MKTVTVMAPAVLLLVNLTGCDRVSSVFGHGDAAASANGAPGAGGSGVASNADPGSLADFEGEIDLSARSKTSPAPVAVNLLVKNAVVRFDVPADVLTGSREAQTLTGGGKVYGILRSAEKKAIVVLDAKKVAVVLDLDQLGDKVKSFRQTRSAGARGLPGAPDVPEDPPKVVKTGKSETVAGTPCEDWDVINANKSKLSICVADKGTSFFHLPLTGIPTENLWALELMDGKHFPLRGVSFAPDGSESGRAEVTKMDKRPLDASLFEIPAGYKQESLDDLIQALMAGGLPGGVPSGDVPPNDVPPSGKTHGGHNGHKHGHHNNGN